jgi:hypothetical protein
MSPTELHDRLDQRFRLLTGAEQLVLGRLPVFAGGFDLAAEAVRSGDLDVLDVADSRYIAAASTRSPMRANTRDDHHWWQRRYGQRQPLWSSQPAIGYRHDRSQWRAPISPICGCPVAGDGEQRGEQLGESGAIPAISDYHAARLTFQNASEPSEPADSALVSGW